ncbi:MAG: hypothetical protein WA405_13290 [Candidatus Acidiferrales bacterium]
MMLALAAAVAPMAIGQDLAQELSKEWGSNSASTLKLEFREIDRARDAGSTRIMYHLETAGFPEGKTYQLWVRQSGDQKVFPLVEGYSADPAGKLICASASPGTQEQTPASARMMHCVSLEIFRYIVDHHVKGEPVDLAFVSTDGSVRAFARAFPFPIQAQDGKCSLTIEILASDGGFFNVHGEGFAPGENLKILFTSGKQKKEGSQQTSPQGDFEAGLLPAVAGKKSGSATFAATGASCHPSVTFDWGKDALKPQ